MIEGLANSSVRRLAMVIAAAVAVWLCYAGVMHGFAGYYGASQDPDDWSRASRLEPSNAEHWYRLGRYRQLDFEHADLPLAISFYRKAVQLDSRSAYYKLDLASALEMSGDNTEAEKYFQGAQANYPLSAEVSWKYGNFLLRQQRLPEAYAEIRRAAQVDPKLIPLAVSRAWRSDPDVNVLLKQVLPDTPEADWEALAFLTDAADVPSALAVWNHLIAQKSATIDWKKSFAFTDLLVSQERYDEAAAAWRQSEMMAGVSPPASKDGSIVFDGGFENDLSGGGFGWHADPIAGAEFDFDTAEKHSGARSARIAFDGTENLAFQQLYQTVVVTPGTHYRFRGYMHTDQISTENGMRFEIMDAKDPKSLDVFTANEKGSQAWTLEETDFTTGPKTRIIRIRLSRSPSTRLDNKLSGTVWIDDVEIVPVASQK